MSQLPELECACCFTDVRADELAQCNEGHLYCKECLEQLASHAIGSNDYAAMHCVDQSGCKADFCIQQRQQFLDRTKMQALDKLEALASVLKASSTDLKNCSFCGEARIVDGGETVFDCPNLDCRKKTCLSCEKEAHTGKSCEDAANNDQSAAQHRVADQMTEALVRTCPGCKARFVKEDGCNLITCRSCRTKTCYICKAVVSGYEHFGKCPLWDKGINRHDQEIKAAREKAIRTEEVEQNKSLERELFQFGKDDPAPPQRPVVPPLPPLPRGYRAPYQQFPQWQNLPVEDARHDQQIAREVVRLAQMRDLAGVPAPGIYDQVPQVVRAAPPKKKRRLDPNDKRPYGILAPPGVTAHVAKAGPLAADVRAVPPAAAKQEAAPSAPHVQTAVPPVEPRADAPIPGISLSKASPQRKPTEQPTNPNPPAPGPIVVNVASKELGKEKNAVLLQGTRAFKAVTRAKPLADCVYTGTSAYITIPDEPIDLTKKVDPCTSGSSSVVRMQVESLERHKPSTSAERPSAESLLTIQPLPKYPTKQFLRTRHAENRLAGRTKIEPVLLADSTTASPSCLGKAISSPPPPRSSPALVMYTRDEHEELINQPLPRLKVNKFNNRRAMPPHHQPTNEIGDCIAKARDPAKTLAMAHAALRSENDMDLPRREVYREPKTRLVYPD